MPNYRRDREREKREYFLTRVSLVSRLTLMTDCQRETERKKRIFVLSNWIERESILSETNRKTRERIFPHQRLPSTQIERGER